MGSELYTHREKERECRISENVTMETRTTLVCKPKSQLDDVMPINLSKYV